MKAHSLGKIFYTVFLIGLMASCSRSYMVKTEQTRLEVEKVNILGVQYHRPEFGPSDHDDFKNKDREFNCSPPQDLWKAVLTEQTPVMDCLNSIGESRVVYDYVPEAQPYLELDAEEKNPECLKTALPKIVLPREIYFLGVRVSPVHPDRQECFSSSFSTKTNQILQTENKFLKKKIAIQFPLSRQLKTNRDLTTWLMVNVFTILKSDENADNKLLASPVPELTCKACFKNDALFDDKLRAKMSPVFWP